MLVIFAYCPNIVDNTVVLLPELLPASGKSSGMQYLLKSVRDTIVPEVDTSLGPKLYRFLCRPNIFLGMLHMTQFCTLSRSASTLFIMNQSHNVRCILSSQSPGEVAEMELATG